MALDIMALLDDLGIHYEEEGKNIAEGWIGLNCPFCDDPSEHLGINIDSGYTSCWRCGKKSLSQSLARISNLSVVKINVLLSKFTDRGVLHRRRQTAIQAYLDDTDIALPAAASKNFPELHTEWLRSRKFNPEEIIKKYDLFSVYQTGKYKYRILAPIYVARRMVSFVARDVTGEARETYLNLPNQESIIPAGRCLYNIDSVDRVALVVEGITDVWRIGRGTVGILGIEFSKAQINLLSGLDKVFVMFDAGRQAKKMSHKFAAMTTSVVKSVEVIEMSTGDPDKLPQDVVDDLRFQIFGRR